MRDPRSKPGVFSQPLPSRRSAYRRQTRSGFVHLWRLPFACLCDGFTRLTCGEGPAVPRKTPCPEVVRCPGQDASLAGRHSGER